jgi:hypothetical protein
MPARGLLARIRAGPAAVSGRLLLRAEGHRDEHGLAGAKSTQIKLSGRSSGKPCLREPVRSLWLLA